ncbi:glutaminyl-peptide cyclotransferase [Flavobacterium chuncheonense]|uniref:Glutaminyl-peptide cyclotransferase n=1 Tax=Flavobacterium chuncheonense TaxID=2026653 RepID=A0ABW5YH55_9FLAO
MTQIKLLAFITLGFLINACEGEKKIEKNIFSIDTSNLKQVYHLNDTVNLLLKNDKNKTIDSIVYYVNDKNVGTVTGNSKLSVVLDQQKLGYQKIKALAFYNGTSSEAETNFTIASSIEPKLLTFKIVNTYPHDIKAYTQGFEFYRDTLFEGTGNGAGNGTGTRGMSSLRKNNYKTGEVAKKIELAPMYFGEGITILNNKVYQLTYKHKEGYVYDADTFEKLKTFKYFDGMQEGWGMTNDGTNLYVSDGTEKIYIVNPETFEPIDYINVYTQHAKIESVNELEWIDGKIWANIYTKDAIAIINPKNGEVESVLNCAALRKEVTNHPDLDFFNGIAYNPKTKTVFVTGKNWDKVFEITVE